MPAFEKTRRNQVLRMPERGCYDKDTICQIIDEALVCHVGFVQGGQPFVIPTIHARSGDDLIFHGAKGSRMMKHIQAGNEICVAITLLDGLVLARSVSHHSMNYRSVMLFGRGRVVEGEQEKLRGLETLTEHIMPGRWRDARKPSARELDVTSVVAVSIDSASAKMRAGPPHDADEDYRLPIWAGVLPIRQQILEPIDDPKLSEDIPLPDYVINYHRK